MRSFATKLIESLKRRGLLGTLGLGVPYLRFLYLSYIDGRFDRKYGTETSEKVAREALEVQSENLQHAHDYQAITKIFFRRMIRSVSLEYSQFIFVDLGSGKGRALMYAAKFPFKKIIGVEFSPKLHTIAEKNIRLFKEKNRQKNRFELYCMDAEDFIFPPENTVLFLYNPFERPVMSSVFAKISQSLKENPREFFVLYRTPWYGDLFERQGFLKLMKATEHYRVYTVDPIVKTTIRAI